MRTNFLRWQSFVVTAVVTLLATSAFANDDTEKKVDRKTEKRMSRIWKTQSPVEGFQSVEMFSAMDSGDINVVIKTKSAADANIMVTNNSDKPLAIELPPAFAAVPVLGQIGGGFGGGGAGRGGGGGGFGGGRGGGGGGLGGGGQQGTGGGFGGGGGGGGFGGGGRGGGGGGRGGGGVFNIPPGRTGKVAINTFCLEHGKPDPEPRMDYVVRPLSVLSSDPKVLEVCQMLANDEITQPVAQAAGWNIANELSWEFLLNKNRVELSTGYYERYFSPGQLELAFRVVEVATERADARTVKEPAQKPKKRRQSPSEFPESIGR